MFNTARYEVTKKLIADSSSDLYHRAWISDSCPAFIRRIPNNPANDQFRNIQKSFRSSKLPSIENVLISINPQIGDIRKT